MDAWSDEGRVYLLGDEPGEGSDWSEEESPARSELSAQMMLIDATSLLLEQGRFEAASALYACELEVEVGEAPSYADAPVWVKIKAPEQLVFRLQDLERDMAWFVREAISRVLPPGYEMAELYVHATNLERSFGTGPVAA
jgi:hypothetical protein